MTVFLWILIGYMTLDLAMSIYQRINNEVFEVTTGVLILITITHGFFIFGAFHLLGDL